GAPTTGVLLPIGVSAVQAGHSGVVLRLRPAPVDVVDPHDVDAAAGLRVPGQGRLDQLGPPLRGVRGEVLDDVVTGEVRDAVVLPLRVEQLRGVGLGQGEAGELLDCVVDVVLPEDGSRTRVG